MVTYVRGEVGETRRSLQHVQDELDLHLRWHQEMADHMRQARRASNLALAAILATVLIAIPNLIFEVIFHGH